MAERVGVSVLCPGIVESELWRSSERRPDALGGAVPAPKQNAVSMRFGLPAEDIAQRVMQGIENESFYVLTHPHVVDIACQRWEETRDAFATQAPRYEGDKACAVPNIMKRLAADSRSSHWIEVRRMARQSRSSRMRVTLVRGDGKMPCL